MHETHIIKMGSKIDGPTKSFHIIEILMIDNKFFDSTSVGREGRVGGEEMKEMVKRFSWRRGDEGESGEGQLERDFL